MSGILNNFILSYPTTIDVNYLIVGGGGSGSAYTGGDASVGGGGAGGLRCTTGVRSTQGGGVSADSGPLQLSLGVPYVVTIGNGGAGVQNGAPGSDGGNSVFHTITAYGGGGGGVFRSGGRNGGCGGGAGAALADIQDIRTLLGGSALAPIQGYAGGTSTNPNRIYEQTAGGGGGGAGGIGGNNNVKVGGSGGNSIVIGTGISTFPLTSSIELAGGGGASARKENDSTVGSGGGTNAGGRGGNNMPGSVEAVPGVAHTGSGGGGQTGLQTTVSVGRGGSGVIYISYPSLFRATLTGTSGLTITNVGSNTNFRTARIVLTNSLATSPVSGFITFNVSTFGGQGEEGV